MARTDFREKDKITILLWCARHCCLCGKACDVDIEIAHIPGEEQKNDLANAISLCYNCHGRIGHYNPMHPRGRKFMADELRRRRDQVYEQYTRHLVPPILARVHQDEDRQLPSVGFLVQNKGSFPAVKARIILRIFLGWKNLGVVNDEHGYYCGETDWHLNPMNGIRGNFSIPRKCVDNTQTLRIQVDITLIDPYNYTHVLLPWSYQYDRSNNEWFLEPTSFEKLRKRGTRTSSS